jgi:hypothetical protein
MGASFAHPDYRILANDLTTTSVPLTSTAPRAMPPLALRNVAEDHYDVLAPVNGGVAVAHYAPASGTPRVASVYRASATVRTLLDGWDLPRLSAGAPGYSSFYRNWMMLTSKDALQFCARNGAIVDVPRAVAGPGPAVAELAVRSNPTRLGSSHLVLTMKTAARCRVVVFDALGRTIRRLADARFEAGVHGLDWDGRDDGGSIVSPGVYFVAVQGESSGERLAFARLVLLPSARMN